MWLAWTLLALIVAVTGQFLVARFHGGGSFVARFSLVGGPISLAMAASLLKTYGLSLEFWGGMFVYAFGCELYVFLGTLVGSSVSV